jgi:hypothetical protein
MRFLQNHFYLSGALLAEVSINLAWCAFTNERIGIFTFRTSPTVLYLSPILASVFTLFIAALFDRFAAAGEKTILRAAAGTYLLYGVGYLSLLIFIRLVQLGTGERTFEHTFNHIFLPPILPIGLAMVGVPLSFCLAGLYLFAHRRLR